MFCSLSSVEELGLEAQEQFALLNAIFSEFDECVRQHSLYKYHHFKDMYVVVSASAALVPRRDNFGVYDACLSLSPPLPPPPAKPACLPACLFTYICAGPDDLLEEIQSMLAIAAQFSVIVEGYQVPGTTWRNTPTDPQQLSLFYGLDLGDLCGAVVGQRKRFYCLFGDAMNVSARLCAFKLPENGWQHRERAGIACSQRVVDVLLRHSGFCASSPGEDWGRDAVEEGRGEEGDKRRGDQASAIDGDVHLGGIDPMQDVNWEGAPELSSSHATYLGSICISFGPKMCETQKSSPLVFHLVDMGSHAVKGMGAMQIFQLSTTYQTHLLGEKQGHAPPDQRHASALEASSRSQPAQIVSRASVNTESTSLVRWSSVQWSSANMRDSWHAWDHLLDCNLVRCSCACILWDCVSVFMFMR